MQLCWIHKAVVSSLIALTPLTSKIMLLKSLLDIYKALKTELVHATNKEH